MTDGDGADLTSTDVRRAAMNLLARREYARAESGQRLERRGMPPDLVASVLDELVVDQLLSDTRFATSFVTARVSKGQGPLRIRRDLEQRGVSNALIDDALKEADVDWAQLAARVRCKRFGAGIPDDYPEQARQMRFLQYRGFDSDDIRRAVATED